MYGDALVLHPGVSPRLLQLMLLLNSRGLCCAVLASASPKGST